MRPVSHVIMNSCENTHMFTLRFLQCRRVLLILTHQIKSDKFYCKSHTPKSMSALIINRHFRCRGRSDNLDPPSFLCCMWINFCCKPWLQISNNCLLLLVSCLAYSSTLKMELVHSLECWWTVLHSVTTQKAGLFIVTAVRTSNSAWALWWVLLEFLCLFSCHQ
jgi:hypothetical protein